MAYLGEEVGSVRTLSAQAVDNNPLQLELTMAESRLYGTDDQSRSRSGPVGGTGDANMGNMASKTSSSSASSIHSDDAYSQPLYKYVACLSCGFVFGFAMEKGRGMLGMVVLATYSGTRRHFLKVCDDFYQGLSYKSITSSALGGILIGIGMPIAGSCPTSVFVQLGSFCPNAHYTMLGGLVATLAYSFLKPVFDAITKPSIEESSNPWTDSPYYVMAMPIAIMFAGLVGAFEMLVPWTTEVQVSGGSTELGVFGMRAWPPYVAGIVVGAIQIPLILYVSQTLGGTSSLVTMVSQMFLGPLKSSCPPFMAAYKKGFSNWWQVFYVSGALGGAFTSAYLSGSLGGMTGVSVCQAFSGGFLLMLGARIAGGCTSGHGITGMGFMSILSLIATAAMFGGGMATGFSMKYILGAY
ncbi:hypothetical protein LSAT2_007377 [Lamellibrachia satsuma]|nr:hypothetical protein LSAT2_007377 [Lamellibrachia satsuma]